MQGFRACDQSRAFRQDLGSHRLRLILDICINNDHVRQARRKAEAPQGTPLVYSWIVSISNLNVIQAPKKNKAEDDEDTKALKEKQKAEAAALAAAKDRGEYSPPFLKVWSLSSHDFSSIEGFVHLSVVSRLSLN